METKTFEEINSWTEVFQTSISSLSELKTWAKKYQYNFSIKEEIPNYPLFLPQRLAHEIFRQGPDSLLWNQFMPDALEIEETVQKKGLVDPIGDLANNKAPQIIHRYQNRVLFMPTSLCPVQCRYCFRKNELHTHELKSELFHPEWEKTLTYLNSHQEIEEIIFTGGDPLVLSNHKLNYYLSEFAKIPHVKFIRFHTRMPAIIPERIDQDFINLLDHWSNHFTLSLMIHTNQVGEWFSNEHQVLLKKIKQLPVILGSQTVLLKKHTLADLVALFKFLAKNHIRPYYLHHPDRVLGAMHFYTELERGKTLYKNLRQQLPGFAIPHYVLDSQNSQQKTLVLDREQDLSYNNSYGTTDSTH